MENTGKKVAKRVLTYDGPLVATNLLREKFSSAAHDQHLPKFMTAWNRWKRIAWGMLSRVGQQ